MFINGHGGGEQCFKTVLTLIICVLIMGVSGESEQRERRCQATDHTKFASRHDRPTESPGFLLWRVTNLWQRRLRAALEPLDLTHAQFVVLAGAAWLTREDEPLTQVQLANHAKIDVMMTSQVLRTLENKGLIERTEHPTDSRAKWIRPTAAGYALVKRAVSAADQADHAFFAHAGDDLPQVLRTLERLSELDEI